MLEKNVTKLTFLVALMATALLVAAGAVRAEAGQVMVDTTWEGWPDVPKVYNTAKGSATRLTTVPMVDLDTNTYEKKFWLSEKQLLSEPVKSVYPKVTGLGSVAYVVYSSRYASKWNVNTWRINRTYSADFGANWSGVYEIQETGSYNAGDPFPIIHSGNAYVANSSDIPSELWQKELLIRSESTDSFILSDSMVIDITSGSSGESIMTPNFLTWHDTLFCLYLHSEDGSKFVKIQKSSDPGESWIPLDADAGTASGYRLSFIRCDSILALVHWLGNEVAIIRSFDRGYTWSVEESVSAMDSVASQGPSAAGDGVSAFHSVWWDYKGVSGGWYGFPFYRRSLDNGDNWEEIKSLAAGPYSDYVDICADSNRVYAIYNDGRWGSPDFSIFLRYSHDQGASWAEEIQLTDEIDPARRPDIYGDGDLVHMVWEEQHFPEYIWGVYYMLGVWYTPGDVDLSNEIDIADLVYIVDWMFSGGAAPVAYDAAQMDGLGAVDIADLVYIVDYMFNDGPPPVGGEGL